MCQKPDKIFRMCTGHRKLNSVTKTVTISNAKNWWLHRHNWTFQIYNEGLWQIPIEQNKTRDSKYTRINIKLCLLEWKLHQQHFNIFKHGNQWSRELWCLYWLCHYLKQHLRNIWQPSRDSSVNSVMHNKLKRNWVL